jgi:hypothetical protein
MLASHQSNQSWRRDTIEMSRLIMPDVIEREREFAHSKWFPYRFISPLRATKHFAALYRRAIRLTSALTSTRRLAKRSKACRRKSSTSQAGI